MDYDVDSIWGRRLDLASGAPRPWWGHIAFAGQVALGCPEQSVSEALNTPRNKELYRKYSLPVAGVFLPMRSTGIFSGAGACALEEEAMRTVELLALNDAR